MKKKELIKKKKKMLKQLMMKEINNDLFVVYLMKIELNSILYYGN